MPQVHLQLPISGLDCRKRAIWEEKATDGAAAHPNYLIPPVLFHLDKNTLLNFLVT